MRFNSMYALALSMLAVMSCTKSCGKNHKSMSPEQVVEAYLNVSLNMGSVEERENLVVYTTGPLKAAIVAAPESAIKEAYIDRKLKLISYSVLERRDRTPRETEITFKLSFQDPSRPQTDLQAKEATVTTENTVAVVRENSLWLIRDVIGAKTTIDFAVHGESEIKASPGPGIDSPSDIPEESNGQE